MAIKIVADAGEVDVEVRKDNEEPIYSGTLTSNLSFTLWISKSGDYKCTVTGRKAKGSVSFIKQTTSLLTITSTQPIAEQL